MQKGFTLIEILVAFGILVAIIPLFLLSLPQANKADRLARTKTTAINLAQIKLEEYMSFSYNDINIGIIEPKANLTEEKFSHFSREVVVLWVNEDYSEATADTGLKQIKVTVFWSEDGKEYTESLSGLKANP